MHNKEALRAHYRRCLRTLTPEYREECGLRLAERLSALPAYSSAQSVSVYISNGPELPTRALIAMVLADGKTLFVPSWQNCHMQMHTCTEQEYMALLAIPREERLRLHGHPIPMPPFQPDCPRVPIDLHIIPGLAFTEDGLRLGHGMGHYDRYLSTDAGLRVGVCYGEQVAGELPEDEHDVRMDVVLTPKDMHYCTK